MIEMDELLKRMKALQAPLAQARRREKPYNLNYIASLIFGNGSLIARLEKGGEVKNSTLSKRLPKLHELEIEAGLRAPESEAA